MKKAADTVKQLIKQHLVFTNTQSLHNSKIEETFVLCDKIESNDIHNTGYRVQALIFTRGLKSYFTISEKLLSVEQLNS